MLSLTSLAVGNGNHYGPSILIRRTERPCYNQGTNIVNINSQEMFLQWTILSHPTFRSQETDKVGWKPISTNLGLPWLPVVDPNLNLRGTALRLLPRPLHFDLKIESNPSPIHQWLPWQLNLEYAFCNSWSCDHLSVNKQIVHFWKILLVGTERVYYWHYVTCKCSAMYLIHSDCNERQNLEKDLYEKITLATWSCLSGFPYKFM